LFSIWKTPDIRVREISELVGITERAVLRIIRELADAGFVSIEKIGRENHYSVTADVPLRHPLEQHRTVNELLEMISNGADLGTT
jgi:predicted transcriptional regulator